MKSVPAGMLLGIHSHPCVIFTIMGGMYICICFFLYLFFLIIDADFRFSFSFILLSGRVGQEKRRYLYSVLKLTVHLKIER